MIANLYLAAGLLTAAVTLGVIVFAAVESIVAIRRLDQLLQ